MRDASMHLSARDVPPSSFPDRARGLAESARKAFEEEQAWNKPLPKQKPN
jgi:hypothetical protein